MSGHSNYDYAEDLAQNILPPLVGQTITKVLVRHDDSLGDTFAGFETDQGVTVWIQADPEGNPGGYLELEGQNDN